MYKLSSGLILDLLVYVNIGKQQFCSAKIPKLKTLM